MTKAQIKASLPVERVVAFLTPTVFMPLSVVVAKESTLLLPGAALSANTVTGLLVTASIGAAGIAGKWLHGRQRYTELESYAKRDAAYAERELAVAVGPSEAKRIETAVVTEVEGLGKEAIAKVEALIPAAPVLPAIEDAAPAPVGDYVAPVADPVMADGKPTIV